MADHLHLTAEATDAGKRLDVFVSEKGDMTRSSAVKRIEAGQVLVNGKPAAKKLKLSGGESVEVEIPEPISMDAKPEDIPLDIIYEDSDIVVVNKPEGMVDVYGVTFSTLAFSEFFDVAGKLPEDTVICFRRLSTASAFTGKEAAEKNYENSKKVLRDIFAFS